MLFDHQRPLTSPRRVVITGAGIITGLGHGWRANADGFRDGRKAFKPVTLFDVSRQRTRMAAEVELPPWPPISLRGARRLQRWDRAAQLLFHAAAECWAMSGWDSSLPTPLVLGTTSGGMMLGEAYYRQAVQRPTDHRHQPSRVIHYLAQQQALNLVEQFDLQGSVTLIANACASGANAVGHAWERIRSGRAERIWAGGYDALSHLVFAGFDALQALSLTECRPFDAGRDGLALGEGAAMLAMESLESAERRGATILAEVCGYGAVTDVHHLTQPHPEGAAALASMQAACEVAGVGPSDIQYVNAHGTGTPLNDSAEAAALSAWGKEASSVPAVSSTKGSIGHLLGAAGAVETVISVMVLREQWLPPQLGLRKVDPACRFPLVEKSTSRRVEHVLTNSFGFGGANASLVLGRWP